MAGVLRGIFGYCFLVLIVRIVGRRPGKQITPFEFILIFFMGGVTLTPMVGDDRSILNAFGTVFGIALTHALIASLKQRFAWFGRLVDGTPLVLINKGRRVEETMLRMRIADDDIMAMARDTGVKRLEDVDYAILERNGEVAVIEKSEDN